MISFSHITEDGKYAIFHHLNEKGKKVNESYCILTREHEKEENECIKNGCRNIHRTFKVKCVDCGRTICDWVMTDKGSEQYFTT